MTRPTAAYIGLGLTHPIRIVINRDLHTNVAKMLSITDALQLMTDLTGAVERAIAQEKVDQLIRVPTDANCPPNRRGRAADDELPPTG